MKLSISKALALGIIGLQVVTVAVIIVSSYVSTEQVLIGHAQKLMRNLSREVIHRSEEFLSPARSAVSLTQNLARHQVVSAEKPREMEQYFFEQLLLYPHIAGIYYGNLEGDFYFVRRSQEIGAYQIKRIIETEVGDREVLNRWYGEQQDLLKSAFDPGDDFDPRTRPWFTKAVTERNQIWTDPYLFFTSKTPGITVASPVFNEQGGVIGVVGVDIDLSALSDFLGYLELSEHSSALILNNNGDVIAYRHAQDGSPQAANASRRLLRIGELGNPAAEAAVASLNRSPGWYVLNTAENTSFSYNDKVYHAVFTPFSDNWPWLLGIYVPEDDFLNEIKQNQRLNILLAAAITLASLVIGVMFARSLSRPIRALQKNVEAVKRGQLEVDIDAGSSMFHDIETTTRAFDSMVAFLKENQQKSEQLKAHMTQQASFMEAVLANIDSGVVVCDLDGRFIYSNRVMNKLRGLPEDARLERFEDTPFSLFDPDAEQPLEKAQWPIFRALAGETVTNQEVLIVSARGEQKRAQVSGRPLYDTQGEKLGAYILVHQVTSSLEPVV